MVPRYEQEDMSALWSDEQKFNCFLKVEIAILEALEEKDIIPKGIAKKYKQNAIINPDRIAEIEKTTKHDVIAFCTSITEKFPAEVAKYFHYGVTSSDVIDSALSLQLKMSLELIVPEFQKLLRALYNKAEKSKNLPCMGRSHGMYAEPMSFGQKILGHYNEFARRYLDLLSFQANELTIQTSGAVGNYTIIDSEIEEKVATKIGLKVEPLSTQVIPRDRIAKLIQIIALSASAIERLCVEIRHLHHSDLYELHEGMAKGQKGSSIMPHKKNPIASENLTGIARILRSHAAIAQENCVLWHERDISHSSAERLYLPDNLGLFLYALRRLTSTVEALELHEKHIESKVYENATYLSSFYLHQILKQSDFYREDVYLVIQKAAFESLEADSEKCHHIFYETLLKELKLKGWDSLKLTPPTREEIKKIYLKEVDQVFKRSMEIYPLP